MTDKRRLRNKLVALYGEEIGAKKFKEALIVAAKSRICIEDVIVKMTKGKLQRINEFQDQKEARAKERLSKRSVYTISGGLPSLGKRR